MSKKVLLCDDEIHIVRAAEIKLARSGYEVRIAHDGEEAWEWIQRDPPDVLVTDVQMPRVDGFELTRRVRSNPATKDLPIIMLTAKSFELTSREIVEQFGVIHVMAKPFSPRELARLVDELLGVAATES
jgi:two-component system, OmpR family, alkaline phosphatase synthesis response regulator PhoP